MTSVTTEGTPQTIQTRRNLGYGILGGVVAASLVALVPDLALAASYLPDQTTPVGALVTNLGDTAGDLIGYGVQIIMGVLGPLLAFSLIKRVFFSVL